MGTLGIFPFMYRGRINNADLATNVGYYEIFGDVSNFPFRSSWSPMLVLGDIYKSQIAIETTGLSYKMYTRKYNKNDGKFGDWLEIQIQKIS